MPNPLRVVELFAGVGGFRYGLEKASPVFETVWANQWEPGKKTQHAYDCYVERYGENHHCVNDNIALVKGDVPPHDLLVGGFPCQSYSIANSSAKGIEGEKGVLWWEIRDILEARRPSYVLLENVDRLLISPSSQRGRDFGIMLRCLNDLGYYVEWRVINAAEYGHVQRRRRVFIFAVHESKRAARMYRTESTYALTYRRGLFTTAFPVSLVEEEEYEEKVSRVDVSQAGQGDIVSLSHDFQFAFYNSGVMANGVVSTGKVSPVFAGKPVPLSKIVERKKVDGKFFLGEDISRWEYLKGSKRIPRVKPNGEPYVYSEGAVPFPDRMDRPGRTMLTSEASVNRSTHVVVDKVSGELRLLTPVECERMNEFPDGWTDTGMPDRYRYFTMGNALVTGVVTTLGEMLVKLDRGGSKKSQ